jgi:hypothetical protein
MISRLSPQPCAATFAVDGAAARVDDDAVELWNRRMYERVRSFEYRETWRALSRKRAEQIAYEQNHGFWWKLGDELANIAVNVFVPGLLIASVIAATILAFAGGRALLVALAGYVPIVGIPVVLLWRGIIDLSKASQPKAVALGLVILVGVASLAWLIALIFVYRTDIGWYDAQATSMPAEALRAAVGASAVNYPA